MRRKIRTPSPGIRAFHQWGAMVVIALAMPACSDDVVFYDSDPPAAVSLSVDEVDGSSVTLSWIAPGDDGDAGRAVRYDLRHALTDIDYQNWDSCTQVEPMPAPQAIGTPESITVSDLSRLSFYSFALRAVDEIPNWSHLSNVVTALTASVTLWGTQGSGPGEFREISGIALDSAGNLYVADDENYRIQKFGPDGSFLLEWGTQGTEDGEFTFVHAVAVHPDGTVFVADGPRVSRFTGDGVFLSRWPVAEPGEGIHWAQDMAIDADGDVYVSEGAYNRIRAFTSEGEFLREETGGAGWAPTGLAVGPEGMVYVAELWNDQILKYTNDLRFVAATEIGESFLGEPVDIALDTDGNLYVCDYGWRRIHKFGPDLEHVWEWGSEGSEEHQFLDPRSIVVTADGKIVVADAGNHRIQRFE